MNRLLLLCLAAPLSAPVRAQTCAGPQGLGGLGGLYGTALDVSADGAVVVGEALTSGTTGVWHAFRWTQAGGMQDLGTLGGATSGATAVSSDGDVVVGFSQPATGLLNAFRWTTAGGMQDLGTLGVSSITAATGVSADGSVVVGQSGGRVFRWTAGGGMEDLGAIAGATMSTAAVSADGDVIVGSYFTLGAERAFRWTRAGGFADLGLLPGHPSLFASSTNSDGSVVVGYTSPPGLPGPSAAFVWTQAGGLLDLGSIGGWARATDVSADGTVVVGDSGAPFRWTAETGMQEIGLMPPTAFVTAVSEAGDVVVGGAPGGPALRLQSSVLGTTYCRDVFVGPNSTGCGGVILATGDPRLATGALELAAVLLPQDVFGFFLTSQTQGSVLFAGGSQGWLCLGGNIGRFVGPGQVMNSGASGSFTLTVDLGAVPAPTLTGTAAVQPGETWNFQVWHRDRNPMPTSNFTDAVSITFR